MPRARSRRFSRRRPTRGKRRFTRRRRSVRRVGRASARSATQGDRGGILNRVGREKPVRLKSMIVGANQQNVSAGTTLATNFVFDPSNSVSSPTFTVFNTAAAPGFSTYAAQYVYYKVRSIKIRMRPFSSDIVLGTNQIRSFIRYQYDVAPPTPTVASISDLPNMKMHWFTPESPEMTYKLYPRIPAPTGASSVTGYFGIEPRKMHWVETSDPVPIYGLVVFHQNFDAGRAFNMMADVEWDILFYKKK